MCGIGIRSGTNTKCLKIQKRETINGGYREVNWNYLTYNFNSNNSKFLPIFRIET
jgi:hypothetical protein